MFTATGFMVMWVAATSTWTRNEVERPPRPCGPIPSSFTASDNSSSILAPSGSLHVEPVCENYPLNFRGLMGRIYIRKRDYLQNFDRNVRTLGLRNITKSVLPTAHNPLMFPSLYLLEK